MQLSIILAIFAVVSNGPFVLGDASAVSHESRQLNFVGIKHLPNNQVHERLRREPRHDHAKPSARHGSDLNDDSSLSGSSDNLKHHHRHHHHNHRKQHDDVEVGDEEETDKSFGFDILSSGSYSPGVVHPAETGDTSGTANPSSTTFGFELLDSTEEQHDSINDVVKDALHTVLDFALLNSDER